MNYKLLALIGIPGIIILGSCTSKNDLYRHVLNDKVKSVQEVRYSAKLVDDKWEYDEEDIMFKIIWEYDKKGNYTKTKQYSDGKELTHIEIPKRKNGEIIEVTGYSKDDEIVSTTKFKKTSANEEEFKNYNKEDEVIGKGKSVWEKERITENEYTSYKSGKKDFSYSIEYERDKRGFIVKTKSKYKGFGDYDFSSRSTSKTEYLKFDKHKNWIKSVEIDKRDKDRGVIVQRKIKYY